MVLVPVVIRIKNDHSIVRDARLGENSIFFLGGGGLCMGAG